MKKLWLMVPILLLGLARAGDTRLLSLTGFSGNGAYVAFQQTAVSDGSGYPYSTLSIVDVARNALVYENTIDLEKPDATENQARAKAVRDSSAALKKYGIQPGDQGRFVFGNSTKTAFEFEAQGKTYLLQVLTRELPEIPECDVNRELLEVQLYLGKTGRSLQKDTKLPNARRCAFNYTLHSAFIKGSSLVAFISFFNQGFEGPELQWMAVTGKL